MARHRGFKYVEHNGILALVYDGAQEGTTALATNKSLTSQATPILQGTPVMPALAVDTLLIANSVASGDFAVAVNRGGNSEAAIWVDASAGLVYLYNRGVEQIQLENGILVINETGADVDTRIEGDNNPTMLVIDAGTDSMALGKAVVTGAFLSVDGSNVNRAPVTSVGLELHLPAATFTKPAAASATTAIVARAFMGIPTFVASTNTATYTDSATLYIAGAAAASTNVTITRAYSIFVDAGNTRLDGDLTVGTTATAGAAVTLNNTASRVQVSGVGSQLHLPAATYTDTNVASTTAIAAAISILQPTFGGSTNAITYTDAASLYIANSPANGTNTNITTAYAIWVDAGPVRFDGVVRLSSGTNALPGLTFQSDASMDTGLFLVAANTMGITAGGTTVADFNSSGLDFAAAKGIRASTSTEVSIQVTNAVLNVGAQGTIILPYLATTNAAGTDADFGDVNGSVGLLEDTDAGPIKTLEARVNTAWISVALSGVLLPATRDWVESDGMFYHKNQVTVTGKDDRKRKTGQIDERICPECGEMLGVGEPVALWTNFQRRNNGDLHAVFGHQHIGRDKEFRALSERVEKLEKDLKGRKN